MLIDSTGGIHLEAAHTIVYKVAQVVHPVLLAAFGLAGSLCQRVLFGDTQVVFLTEPEAELEAHVLEASDEQAMVFLLRVFA